jgi:hypothetical protein
LTGSEQGQVAGCCELGDESMGFKNARNLLTIQGTILKLLTPCILINLFSFTEPTKCTYIFSWFNTKKILVRIGYLLKKDSAVCSEFIRCGRNGR